MEARIRPLSVVTKNSRRGVLCGVATKVLDLGAPKGLGFGAGRTGSYAVRDSCLDSTRSINGRMPNSLEMADG